MAAGGQHGPKRASGRMRSLAAIAAQEAGRLRPTVNVRTIVAAALVASLAVGAWVVAGPQALKGDRGIYPVGLTLHSPFASAVHNDTRFRIVDGSPADAASGRITLWLGDDGHPVYDATSARSRAAYGALQQAVRAEVERGMAAETNASAAYPVSADLVSQVRAPSAATSAAPTAAAAGPTTTASSPAAPDVVADAPKLAQKQVRVPPGQLQPPFPVRSLVLSFAYLIPMNLVAQLCAGSLLADRTRRRAVLLLSAPIRPWTILAGRVAPYAALAVLVLVGAGIATGAGWIGWLAAVPIVACVLASGIVVGLLARNLRELTFLLTGGTTTLSIFLLLPAMFSALPAVAALSPVSIVASSIRAEPVTLAMFLTATVPLALTTCALLALAAALYREETLFSQHPLVAKTVAAVGARMGSRPLLLVVAGLLTVPFGFGLELLVLSFVIPVGLTGAIPLLLVGVAGVEEGLKLLVVRANRAAVHPGKERRPIPDWRAGLWVGSGFFLGEKMALLLALTGFGLLSTGPGLLIATGGGTGFFLVAPLLLHCATAATSATLAGRGHATLGWLAATLLHVAYNASVLLLGGAL